MRYLLDYPMFHTINRAQINQEILIDLIDERLADVCKDYFADKKVIIDDLKEEITSYFI